MSISQLFPDEGPTLNLNFAGSRTLDPRITFTRTSSATHMGPDGLIKIAAANSPRFDHSYNSATGEIESLGLLVEETRTNLLLQSEDFGTTWDATRASVSTNSIAAPNGTITADKLTEDNTASNSHFVAQSSISFVSGTIYTFSVYVKSAEKSQLRLAFLSTAFGTAVAYNFDLSAVTATQQTSGTNDSGSIVSIGDGWYRCRISAQTTASVSATVSIFLLSAGLALYTGDGTSGLYIWGAQVEVGSFLTSYIPTSGSTVTRTADNVSMVGENFSSWYNQSEGTVVATANSKNLSSSTFPVIADFSVNSSNRLRLSYITSTLGGGIVGYEGITSAQAYPAVSSNPRNGALSYSSTGNYSVVFNSGVVSNFSGTFPVGSFSVLTIGNSILQNTSNNINGHISRLTYYPKRLPNAFLQNLTK
jgi:hypothetical protein